MPQDTRSLPQGAGATTGSTPATDSTPTTGFIGSGAGGGASAGSTGSTGSSFGSSSSAESGSFRQDLHETGYRSSGRAVLVSERASNGPSRTFIFGSVIVGAVAGAAIPFMLSGRSSSRSGRSQEVDESVTINRPAREIYDFWRNFENLPQFMDNVKSVETLGGKRSHWVIKAPAGSKVEFDSFVTEEVPGRLIAWQSEEGASVPNRGRVEFEPAPGGGSGTLVRARISYDPPAGAAGRIAAKLFRREPGVQAREDLNRLKQLMEGGGAR